MLGTMKRRTLVFAPLAAAGALAVGWALVPPRERVSARVPRKPIDGAPAFNGWVHIGEDDRVHLVCGKTEMGQGVHTALAMLLAEELDADWRRIEVAPAPQDPVYGNLTVAVDALPFQPDDEGVLRRVTDHLTTKLVQGAAPQLTGGSTTLRDLWWPLRQAGASARAMLVAEAAARWAVPEAEVAVAAGVLRHAASGRSLRFGELALAAARRPLPSSPRLKPAAEWVLIGRAQPHRDAAARVQGRAVYGIDVRPPGLRHAALQLAPTLTGRVVSVDDRAARAMPGVRAVVPFEPPGSGGAGGVAVIADSHWQARQAAEALVVQWDPGAAAGESSTALLARCRAALDSDEPAFPVLDHGGVEAALAGAARLVEAVYTAPLLAHATLEPPNATVLVEEGRATVWASTQAPDLARGAVARALGLPEAAVTVNVTLAGGGFGRRLDVDFIEQAALVARALPGTPVQTLWTREQDTRHDFYRPPALSRLRAGLDAAGRLVAWDHHTAGPPLLPAVMQRYASATWRVPALSRGTAAAARLLRPLGALPGVVLDKAAVEGGFDAPYEWPAARMRHTPVATAVPVGFWRAVGHSQMGFFNEAFLDEVAAAAGADPVDFRRQLLAAHPRERAVLERAAAAAGWGTPVGTAPDGAALARGVALHRSFGSTVALVAEVSRGGDGRPRVHRVSAAIDCGLAVNPGHIRQQVEGAVVQALSAALSDGVSVEDGRVMPSNFHDLPLLRLPEAPQVQVEILPGEGPPQGVGEPGLPPVAPAVANALAALTGRRWRRFPLGAEAAAA